MLDTRRTQVEPVASQVTSTSSQVTEPLIVKDQRTARPTYGSTTPEVLPKDGRKVVVSDQILVSAVANLSTAYNLAVINYALMMLQRSYPDASLELRSTVDACSLVGAIMGQLTFGYVGAIIGRRKGMIFTLLLSILGAAASAILPWGTTSVYQILAASRFVLGVGVGGVYPLSAASAVEATNDEDELNKSKIVAAVFSFQGIGQLLAPLMAYIMLAVNAHRAVRWRVLLLVGAFPGLFVLRRAYQVKEHSSLSSSTTPPIGRKRADLEVKACRPKLWDKVKASTSLQRKLFGACASWFLFDVTFYGNVIFTPIILQDTYGLDKHHLADVALCSLVVAAIALPGNLLAVFVVGRMSFRTIQIMGFVAMGLLFLVLGIFYEQLLHYRGLLLGLYALTFFFSNFGPNVCTFCLPAELFAKDVRVELNGVAAATGKLGAAVGAASFGIIEAQFGVSRLLVLSAMVSLLGAFVTYKFIPTKHYTSLGGA